MTNRDTVSIVWGETSALKPKPQQDSDKLMERLRAVVAKLAAAANHSGLDSMLHKEQAPGVDNDDAAQAYKQVEQVAGDVEANTFRSDTPLPARAVLWEVADNGSPRHPQEVPAAATWILDQGVAPVGTFVAGQGGNQRNYGLF
jgi:hypothetical protein